MSIETVVCQVNGTYPGTLADARSVVRFVVPKKSGDELLASISWPLGPARLRAILQSPKGEMIQDKVNHPVSAGLSFTHLCKIDGPYSVFISLISVPERDWHFTVNALFQPLLFTTRFRRADE